MSAANHIPYVSQIETHVHCVNPRFLRLYTIEKLPTNCPKTHSTLMHVKHDDSNLEISVEVLDAEYRRLQNITSLVLDWQFLQSNDTLLAVEHHNLVKRVTETELQSGIEFPKRDFLVAALPSDTFKIKVVVNTYDETILGCNSITYDEPEFGIVTGRGQGKRLEKPIIENVLSVLAVNSTLLPFNSVSVFLSHNNEKRIRIVQGSGFYELKIPDFDIVNAVIDSESREIVITPRKIGQVRIEVIDRCLSTEASELLVSVVSIGKIEIQVGCFYTKSLFSLPNNKHHFISI